MDRYINNPSIDECCRRIREEAEQSAARKIKRAEQNYQVASMLDGAGFNLGLPNYWDGQEVEVQLGEMPPKSAKKKHAKFVQQLVTLRALLGRLINTSTYVQNARKKTLCVVRQPKGLEGVRIYYVVKAPKDAKCKIVTRRETQYKSSLVCDR